MPSRWELFADACATRYNPPVVDRFMCTHSTYYAACLSGFKGHQGLWRHEVLERLLSNTVTTDAPSECDDKP